MAPELGRVPFFASTNNLALGNACWRDCDALRDQSIPICFPFPRRPLVIGFLGIAIVGFRRLTPPQLRQPENF